MPREIGLSSNLKKGEKIKGQGVTEHIILMYTRTYKQSLLNGSFKLNRKGKLGSLWEWLQFAPLKQVQMTIRRF